MVVSIRIIKIKGDLLYETKTLAVYRYGKNFYLFRKNKLGGLFKHKRKSKYKKDEIPDLINKLKLNLI